MESTKRIAINTGFLYGKMLITLFVSFYSTRLILDALGIEDFGIFQLVGGVIGMLSFLNGAMAVSTQRYLSYYLGDGDKNKQLVIFNASVLQHLIIGVLIVIGLEIIGFFFFDELLNIPDERMSTAKIVYQFMILVTFINVNSVPYDASINAHENMLLHSLADIFMALTKLGIAILLTIFFKDKLIVYGVLLAASVLIVRVFKGIYCRVKYEECKIQIEHFYHKELFKEMFSFAGWNLFGAMSNVIRNQGVTVILNVFVGVIANAAYGIANQINGQLSAFSMNLMKAINPQIVKSEGAGDRLRMLKLATFSSKLSFFLISFFSVPIILEIDFLLNLWLKTVPEWANLFCQLIIISSMIKQFSGGLMVAVQSVGRIKTYQFTVSTLLMLTLPLSVILLKLGYPPYSVLIGIIVFEIIALIVRIVFASNIAQLNGMQFFLKTVLRSSVSISFAYLTGFILKQLLAEDFIRFFIIGLVSSIIIIFVGGGYAFSKEEKKQFLNLFKSSFNKILSKKLFNKINNI